MILDILVLMVAKIGQQTTGVSTFVVNGERAVSDPPFRSTSSSATVFSKFYYACFLHSADDADSPTLPVSRMFTYSKSSFPPSTLSCRSPVSFSLTGSDVVLSFSGVLPL